MPIATLSNIEKTFGRRTLFDHLDFQIDRGERVGLIGDNGSGKTSLFRVLTGELPIDSGTVAIAKSIRLGHLTQDPVFQSDSTALDEAELAFARLHELSHLLRDLEHGMELLTGDALEKILRKYQEAQHEFELAGGYAWRHRLEATLLGVGLERQTWEQPVGTLSGGQKSRLALAKLLISQPDLLLLDEPTNHLDLAALAWLEEYLGEFSGAVLLISHDRYLLDRLSTRIVWLHEARLTSYPGNYSAFVAQRQMQELAQQRAYEEQQADIAKQQEFIRRFGAGQRSKEAKGREKRLDRLLKSDALIGAVGIDKQIRMSLETDQRAGDRVLSARELSKAYDGKQLWKDIALEVKHGERIGIIGPNGSGKTTLLETLLGRRDADSGIIRWGANLSISYYEQNLDDLDDESTVAEEVRGDRNVTPQDLHGVLALMLFRGEAIDKPISLLSGGERARVAIARMLLDKPNVLLLDEPTNHLDIASREALEGALKEFPGTILCVSHDRYFLDQVATRMLILTPPTLIDFDGNYSAWAAKQHAQAARKTENKKTQNKPQSRQRPRPTSSPKPNPKRDNPQSRQFGQLSIKDLEGEIAKTESAIADCQGRFGDAEVFKDPTGATKLKADYKSLQKKLADLEAEYFAREK